MNASRNKIVFILTICLLASMNSGMMQKLFKPAMNLATTPTMNTLLKQTLKPNTHIPLINAHSRVFENGNPTGYVHKEDLGTNMYDQMYEARVRNENQIMEQRPMLQDLQQVNLQTTPKINFNNFGGSDMANFMKQMNRPVFEPPLINAHHRVFENGNPTGRIGENDGMPNMYEQMYENRVRAQNENPQQNQMSRFVKKNEAQKESDFDNVSDMFENLKILDNNDKPITSIFNGPQLMDTANKFSQLSKNQLNKVPKIDGIVSKIFGENVVKIAEPVKFEIKVNYGKGDLEKKAYKDGTEVPSVIPQENKVIQNVNPESKTVTVFNEGFKDIAEIKVGETQLANLKKEVTGLTIPSHQTTDVTVVNKGANDLIIPGKVNTDLTVLRNDKNDIIRFNPGENRISNLIPETTDLTIKANEQNSLANLQQETKELINVNHENTLPVNIQNQDTRIANLNPRPSDLLVKQIEQTNLAEIRQGESQLSKFLPESSELSTNNIGTTNIQKFRPERGGTVKYNPQKIELIKVDPENGDVSEDVKNQILLSSKEYVTNNIKNFRKSVHKFDKISSPFKDIENLADTAENMIRVENFKSEAVENYKKAEVPSTHNLDFNEIVITKHQPIKSRRVQTESTNLVEKIQNQQENLQVHEPENYQIKNSEHNFSVDTSILRDQPTSLIEYRKPQTELSVIPEESKNLAIIHPEVTDLVVLKEEPKSLVNFVQPESRLAVIPVQETRLVIKNVPTQESSQNLSGGDILIREETETTLQQKINSKKSMNKNINNQILMHQMLHNPMFPLQYSMMLQSGKNPMINEIKETPKLIPDVQTIGLRPSKMTSMQINANKIFKTHNPYIQKAINDGTNIANSIPAKGKWLDLADELNSKTDKEFDINNEKTAIAIDPINSQVFQKKLDGNPQKLTSTSKLNFFKFNPTQPMPLHTLFDPVHKVYLNKLFSGIGKDVITKTMKENPYVQRNIKKYDDIDTGIRKQTNTQFEMDHIINKFGAQMILGPLGNRPLPNSGTIAENYKKVGDFDTVYNLVKQENVPISDDVRIYAQLKDYQYENEENAKHSIYLQIWEKDKYLSELDTLEKYRGILPADKDEVTRKIFMDGFVKFQPTDRAKLVYQMEQIFTPTPETYDQDILLDLPMYNFVLNVEEKCIEIFAIELCDEISGILNTAYTKFGGLVKRDFSLVRAIASQLIENKYPDIHKYLESVGVMPGFADYSQRMHDRLFFLLFGFENPEN